MKTKEFVFGKGAAPEWFTGLCSVGKAKVAYDDEGEPLKAIVYAPTGSQEAHIGDTIVFAPSGLAVLPKKDSPQKKGKAKDEGKEEIKQEAPDIAPVADEADLVGEVPDGE